MSLDQSLDKILIIDFGSQFTQLIARRIRELGVFSEIISHKKIKKNNIDKTIKGIILSGGPLNVYEIKKYSFDSKIIQEGITVLGICFGHQILSKINGGRVKQSKHREFGLANISKKKNSVLTKKFFKGKNSVKVWKSDSEIDSLYSEILMDILNSIKTNPDATDALVPLLFIARYLERVGDQATNVAEETYFVVTGEDLEGLEKTEVENETTF